MRRIEHQLPSDADRPFEILIGELRLCSRELLAAGGAGHPAQLLPIDRAATPLDLGWGARALRIVVGKVEGRWPHGDQCEMDVNILPFGELAVDGFLPAEMALEDVADELHVRAFTDRVAERRSVDILELCTRCVRGRDGVAGSPRKRLLAGCVRLKLIEGEARDRRRLATLSGAEVVLDAVLCVLPFRRGRIALQAARLVDGTAGRKRAEWITRCRQWI